MTFRLSGHKNIEKGHTHHLLISNSFFVTQRNRFKEVDICRKFLDQGFSNILEWIRVMSFFSS